MKPPSEADTIKLLAALTAAPRWVTALMPADGAIFAWGESAWWHIVSGVCSLLFAAVETYAAAYIMRAWREAKSEAHSRRLMWLWVATLAVLVAVVAPAVFANVAHIPLDSLPVPLLVAWSGCVAASIPLVIGGVGYAERARVAPSENRAKPSEQLSAPSEAKSAFACPDCDFVSSSQNALNGHRITHRKIKATANGH